MVRQAAALMISAALLCAFGCHSAPRVEVRDALSSPVEGWVEMNPRDGEQRSVWVAPEPTLTSEQVAGAQRATDNAGRVAVMLELTDEGAARMAALSAETIGEPVAMFIDDVLVAAPIVMSQLSGRIMITGVTESEAERLVNAFGRR